MKTPQHTAITKTMIQSLSVPSEAIEILLESRTLMAAADALLKTSEAPDSYQ
ncbi:MAG: hypothetical protein ACRD8A_01735 [Candidatus Acidiferrales bacterium]